LLEQARDKIQHQRLQELEFPAGIAIDNRAHPTYTLVQIEAPDRVGLLYDLLTALGQEGANIVLSRISTQKGAAIDTFYITDSTVHAKITDSHRIAALQRRLRSAVLGGAAK
jgi:[protein-PII] uridylyltransferase